VNSGDVSSHLPTTPGLPVFPCSRFFPVVVSAVFAGWLALLLVLFVGLFLFGVHLLGLWVLTPFLFLLTYGVILS
jgi:hypothetical protein